MTGKSLFISQFLLLGSSTFLYLARMKSGCRGVLLGALLIAASATVEPAPAHAQIMVGFYCLLQSDTQVGKLFVEDLASGGAADEHWLLYSSYQWPSDAFPEQPMTTGDIAPSSSLAVSGAAPRVVGLLQVPPHSDPDAPYEEHWMLFPEYRDNLEGRERLTIVPLDVTPDLADRMISAAASRGDVTHRHVTAQREDLPDPADGEGGHLCDVSGMDQASEFRGIWQRESLEVDAARLVGFVGRVPRGADAGHEQWCLTAQYVYPTIGSSTITELSPASRDEIDLVAGQVRAELSMGSSPHAIGVETTDRVGPVQWVGWNSPRPLPGTATPGDGATFGCSTGAGHVPSLWYVAAGFAGIALARLRARNRRAAR